MRKVLGVLGGMGPAAAALFVSEVVRHTDARSDQEHIDAVIMQHCSLPDRTAALIDPVLDKRLVRFLLSDVRALVAAGATILAVPCNTVHAWLDEICTEASPSAKVLDMVSLAAERVALLGGVRVGVLATDGTRLSGVYDRAFARFGIHAVYPSHSAQGLVMEAIYGQVKSGFAANPGLIGSVLGELASAGCDSAVLGCTELSVAVSALAPDRLRISLPIVDALDELVRASIVSCGYLWKP